MSAKREQTAVRSPVIIRIGTEIMRTGKQSTKPFIAVVGAGPAGSSLAIRLARQNFRVCLIEREKFPRHKLCGEFISPECLEHFRELGVLEEMLVRGGDRITQTIFYSRKGRSVSVPSEWFGGSRQGALGLSRAEMDLRLLEKARALGVEVLEEHKLAGLLFADGRVGGVRVRNKAGEIKEIRAGLTVDATGRAGIAGKMAKKEMARRTAGQPQKKNRAAGLRQRLPGFAPPGRLVGFKAHLNNVKLEKGRCEIYFFRGGYGGLNYVEEGRANHCFLIRSEVVREFRGDADMILREVIFRNERARETMHGAGKDFDWLAVSVDGFGVRDLNPAEGLLAVGDASAFIDPFTGSGMLIALESSAVLARVLREEHPDPVRVAELYRLFHKENFRRRLRVCAVMRRLSFAPSFAGLAISALSLSNRTREFLVRLTRENRSLKRT